MQNRKHRQGETLHGYRNPNEGSRVGMVEDFAPFGYGPGAKSKKIAPHHRSR